MGSKILLILLIELWTGPVLKIISTSNYMLCRAITDSLPEENLSSLGESYYRTIQIFRGQFICNSQNKPCNY